MKTLFKSKLLLLVFLSFTHTTLAESYTPFVVLGEASNDLVVSDGYSDYLLDYDWNCSSMDFTIGEIFYIATYYLLSYGDEILVQGWLGDWTTCSVTNSDELDLNSFFITEVIDTDQVIAYDMYGDSYSVKYGFGCSSMWKYEGKSIYIDVGGTQLDGISDDIYLLEDGDVCSVWDAEELSNTSTTTSCLDMINGYLGSDGTCYCNTGYTWSDETASCVEYTTNTNTSPFLDITESDNSFDAITYLYNNGIITGYSDGTFRPNDPLNRAELLKILVEGIGITPDATQYANCFSDVKTEWYAKYVCYAKEQGWVEGYLDGSFLPANNVNKVEAVKMLLEVFDVEIKESDTSPYIDVPTTEWYSNYILTAYDLGLLEEVSFYLPGADITRSGISENIYRLLIIQ